ncbi:MAG TPA: ROK family protein [Alphaproteobacteria bacterium]|nr:ROK family protein [Alphaproteobacteria bacterium]
MAGAAQAEEVFVGIDVGGTKTALGLVAFPHGTILRRVELPTPQGAASGRDFLDDVARAARRLIAEAPGCRGIGLGLCELVDRGGRVDSAHRVHWRGLPVRETLSAIAPAVVEADVRAAALAEIH